MRQTSFLFHWSRHHRILHSFPTRRSSDLPHYHDQARYITVIKGTWWVSLGAEADVYNPDKMTPVKQGSFIFEPAFGHHYDMAKDEEVIVQIMGPGPVKTTQLENNGAPSGDRSGGVGRGGRN